MGKVKFVDENSAVAALVEHKDKVAFEYLYLKYRGTIERLVAKYIYNPDDRLEIEQSIWAQVYAKAHTFQRKSLFISWVYRISVNFCLNFLNSVSRNPLYKQSQLSYISEDGDTVNNDFVDFLKVDETTPLDLLENEIDIQLFNKTFAELSPEIQHAFERIQQGFSNDEIANETDSLSVTVRSRTLRVRNTFRSALLLKELESNSNIAVFIDVLLNLESEKLQNEDVIGRGLLYMKSLPDDKLETYVMVRDGHSYQAVAEWLGVSERDVADTLIEIKTNLCKLIKLV